jgi:flagellar basal body-associated protein FliL
VSLAENRAGSEEVRTLRNQIEELTTNLKKLEADLEAERSKGFWSKVFGRPATSSLEGMRERVRGRIAMALIVTLILVVLATLGYLVWLSFNLAALTTDDLNTLIPMIGTTLLTPLVGLIGAVTGFYFGGLTAVQAASQGHAAAQEATQQGAQATQQGAQQGARAATTGAQVATDGATQAATDAAVQAVTGQSPQQQTGDR